MKKIFQSLGFAGIFLLAASPLLLAADKIKVVTTTSTFADFVQEIGKDQVDVYAIAPPNRDIHFITPTPKDIVKMKKADVFVHGGLDLEAWRNPLLDAVGRGDFMGTEEKAVNVSKGIPLLEAPASLSRAQGDQHGFGNPHYWMNPENAKIIVDNITEKFSQIFPDKAAFFQQNAGAYKKQLDQKIQGWQKQLAPYLGKLVAAYHNDWVYFTDRFGIQIAGYLEPKPGIPPTPRHFKELEAIIRDKNVKVIIREIFHESGTPKKLAKKTGAKTIVLKQEAGEAGNSYIQMLDEDVRTLAESLSS